MFENRGGLWVIKPNPRLWIGINVVMVVLSLAQAGFALSDDPIRPFAAGIASVGAVAWASCAALNLLNLRNAPRAGGKGASPPAVLEKP
jgi:hypothetical protein